MAEKVKERIFSGKPSKSMWEYINKLRDYSEPTHMAIYVLACRYQELEALVRKLQQRVESEQ